MKKLKLILIFLLIPGLVLPGYSALEAISEEGETLVEEEPTAEDASVQGIPQNKPQKPEYVPGQLIVKLKEGKTLADIADLNQKYGVTQTEKVFPETPPPEKVLEELKSKYEKITTPSHDSWYWQLDKNSKEYKEYTAKIEKEKEELKIQIQEKEEILANLEARRKKGEDIEPPRLEGTYVLMTDTATNIPAMAKDYSQNPNVEYAEPNYLLQLQGPADCQKKECDKRVIYPAPSDKEIEQMPHDPFLLGQDLRDYFRGGIPGQPDLPTQYGYITVKARYSQCSKVTVAIIDSGIDPTNKELIGRGWINQGEWGKNGEKARDGKDNDNNGKVDDYGGWNWVDNNNNLGDTNGHGTGMAYIIAAKANDGMGIAGLNDCVQIMPLKVIDDNGSAFNTYLADAIRYAADNGADIINISMGSSCGGASVPVSDAVNYAQTYGRKGKGCVVITGGGNHGVSASHGSISSIKGVVSVGAVDSCGNLADVSGWDAWASNYDNDLVAPGTNIVTAKPPHIQIGLPTNGLGDGFTVVDGTSIAAPYVTALAALILKAYPELSYEEVNEIILMSTRDLGISGTDPEFGAGVVDYQKFLEYFRAHKSGIDKINAKIRRLEVVKNKVIKVFGTADGEDFQRYYLEYALRSQVSECGKREYTDFVPFKFDTQPQTNGLLGELDAILGSPNLPPGEYIIRLRVIAKDGCEFSDYKSVHIQSYSPPKKPVVEDEGDFLNRPVLKAWWDSNSNDLTIDYYLYSLIEKNIDGSSTTLRNKHRIQGKQLEIHGSFRKYYDGPLPPRGGEIYLAEGATYYFEVEAYNDAGGGEPGHSDGITIDRTPPVTSISPVIEPETADIFESPLTITLNAKDNLSGVRSTFYNLDGSGKKLYTGPITISEKDKHRLRYFSVDKAGNEEKVNAVSFIVKSRFAIKGGLLINEGDKYTNNPKVLLEISIPSKIDKRSVVRMQLANHDLPNAPLNWLWSGPYRRTIEGWQLSPGDGEKGVYVRFLDASGQELGVYSDTIILDTTPPTACKSAGMVNSGIDIVGGIAKNRDITIKLCATDNLSGMGDGAQMKFYEEGAGGWTEPEPYAATKTFTLTTPGNGQKTVHLMFKDAAGNWSGEYEDTVYLSATEFKATLLINGSVSNCTQDRNVKLTYIIYSQNPIAKMQFSNNGQNWSELEDYQSSRDWMLSEGEGGKTVFARFRDDKDNWSEICRASIWYKKDCKGSGGGGDKSVVPAAPSDLQVSSLSSSRVRVSWQDNADNEDEFLLGKSAFSSGPFVDSQIEGNPGTGTVTYDMPHCNPGGNCSFKVRACNSAGCSIYSNTASVTTGP